MRLDSIPRNHRGLKTEHAIQDKQTREGTKEAILAYEVNKHKDRCLLSTKASKWRLSVVLLI